LITFFFYIYINHRYTSLKEKHEPKHSVRQKKLNSYIHHVVANNLPPTAALDCPSHPSHFHTQPHPQSPHLNHASLVLRRSPWMKKLMYHKASPNYTSVIWRTVMVKSKMRQIIISLSTSTISVDSNELISANSNENNNNTMPATEDNPFIPDHGNKSSSSVNEDPVAHIMSIKMSSKVPKKPPRHIKRLSTRSSPPASTAKSGKHKTNAGTGVNQKLPVLRNRSIHQSSSFDTVALLRNAGPSK